MPCLRRTVPSWEWLERIGVSAQGAGGIIRGAMNERLLLQIIADQLASMAVLAKELEFVKSALVETPMLHSRYSEAAKHQPNSPTVQQIDDIRRRVQAILDRE